MGGNAGTQTTVAVPRCCARLTGCAASFVRRELAVAVMNGILFPPCRSNLPGFVMPISRL